MYKPNPVLKRHVDAVWSKLSPLFCRGYLLLWSDIERITGVVRGRSHRDTVMFQRIQEKLRCRILTEMKIKVRAERGVGYHFLDVRGQIIEGAIGRSKRASKQLFRGSVEVGAVNQDASMHERVIADMASDSLKKARKSVNKERRVTQTVLSVSPLCDAKAQEAAEAKRIYELSQRKVEGI